MVGQALVKIAGVGMVLTQYACLAHCALEFVGDFVICSGPSMQPNINSSDIILTEHLTIFSRRITKGDIVIARSPTNPKQHICKRVTGTEGDILEQPPPNMSYKYIPRGHVWLEGDNKSNSSDSRAYGPVPYGLLRSRVFFKIWPLREFGFIGKEQR